MKKKCATIVIKGKTAKNVSADKDRPLDQQFIGRSIDICSDGNKVEVTPNSKTLVVHGDIDVKIDMENYAFSEIYEMDDVTGKRSAIKRVSQISELVNHINFKGKILKIE